MGFSKDNFEQYRREIRIMWRVLSVGAVVAGSVHILSLPWISRMISRSEEGNETEAIPIEVVVLEDEVVQQTPDPEPEPKENSEPAASAERPSAAPLATNTEPVPTSEVASADTLAVAPAIATENGEAGGQGAVGTSSAIGLVSGTGEPSESGDRINLPNIAALIEPPSARPREQVQETTLAARRQPASRLVSCNPCSLPDFPASARRQRNQGKPVINAVFDENGRVVSAEIEVSSGNREFDQAALEEARRNWRFQDPQGLGGQVSVDVLYVIDDSEQAAAAERAGEVRAVELPVGQQIRSIAPDQPSPPAAATNNQGTGSNAGSTAPEAAGPSESSGSSAETEPSGSVPDSPAPATPEPAPSPSEPIQAAPIQTAPTAPAPSAPAAPPDISPPPAPTPRPAPPPAAPPDISPPPATPAPVPQPIPPRAAPSAPQLPTPPSSSE